MKYELIRSGRRTLAVQILETGEVVVRAPKHAPKSEIERFLLEKQDWILKHQRAIQDRNSQPSILEHDPQWYKERATILYPKRVQMYEPLVGVKARKIRVGNAKTRWGSCNSYGDLMLHWRLLLADVDILDYVIVHELCHIHEMNHSKDFWKQVERVLPDYRERRKWLRENGYRLR